MTEQEIAAFEAELTEQGYVVTTKSMDPSMTVDEHTHDFDVRGLVTSGEFSITVEGNTRRIGLGEEFAMAAGCPHSEVVGPEGVSFVLGRRKV